MNKYDVHINNSLSSSPSLNLALQTSRIYLDTAAITWVSPVETLAEHMDVHGDEPSREIGLGRWYQKYKRNKGVKEYITAPMVAQ